MMAGLVQPVLKVEGVVQVLFLHFSEDKNSDTKCHFYRLHCQITVVDYLHVLHRTW